MYNESNVNATKMVAYFDMSALSEADKEIRKLAYENDPEFYISAIELIEKNKKILQEADELLEELHSMESSSTSSESMRSSSTSSESSI